MAKKKHKLPKKPKKSAGLAVWERYDQRVKDYHKKIQGIGASEKKRQSIIKKYS